MLAKLQFIVSTFKWSRTHDPDGHSAQQEKEINIESFDFFLDVLSSHDSFQIQMLSNLEQSNRQWDVWREAEKARQKSSTGSCKIDFIFLSFNENCKFAKSKFWVPSPSSVFSRSWDTSLFKSGKNIPTSKKT